jgi:hypothetical protein
MKSRRLLEHHTSSKQQNQTQRHRQRSLIVLVDKPTDEMMSVKEEVNVEGEEAVANMSLMDIIEGENDRGIPTAKFVDDLGAFAESFTPVASAELLIGAYTELHTKYKSFEITLNQKRKLSLSTVLWHWWLETVSLTLLLRRLASPNVCFQDNIYSKKYQS